MHITTWLAIAGASGLIAFLTTLSSGVLVVKAVASIKLFMGD